MQPTRINMISVRKIFAITTLSLCMSLANAATPNSESGVQEYDTLITQLNSQIVSKQSEIEAINKRIDTAKNFISKLDPYSESQDNLKKLQAISELLIAKKNEITEDIANNKSKIEDLKKSKLAYIDNQAQLVTQANYTSDIQAAIDSKSVENNKLLAEKSRLELEAQTISTQINTQQLKNEELKKKKEDALSFLTKIDADIKISQETLDAKKQQAESYKRMLDEQEKQNAGLTQKIEIQKFTQKQQEDILKKLIEDEKKNSEQLTTERNKIIKENQILSASIEDNKKYYQNSLVAKEQLGQKIKTLETALDTSKKRIKEINNQNIALFEAAKKSLVQNNQDVDSINTGEAVQSARQINTDAKVDTSNVNEFINEEAPGDKMLYVTKSLSSDDQFVKSGNVKSFYTVKRGDTLGLIIKGWYDTKTLSDTKGIIKDIEKLNALPSSDRISVGQQLLMPNYNNLN